MKKLSIFGEDFLLLALRINKHIKGYVDFYYGPEKLRQNVDSEAKTSPSKLMIDSNNLLNELDLQGYDINRERYLEKMLIAMRTSIELLNGIEISIEDQFLKLYDVALQPANESELRDLKKEYDEAYGGSGSLEERLDYLRVIRKVPEANVFTMFKKALNIVRKQTNKLFRNLLPEEEHISIDLVEKTNDEIKWSYYNWYLGNYHSRIEVNPNYAMYWTSFISAASHEGYPGHHTEFVLNEKNLFLNLNQFEHSILILHSPKIIISEGIANLANSLLYSNKESAEIGLREFCTDVSKETSLENIILQDKLKVKIPIFWYNFAYHAVVDKYSEEELIQYGKNVELFNEEVLKMELKRLSNPAYSKNAFLYNLGTNVLKQKYGKKPSVNEFQNLLVNPTLPSDLI
ncbi:MAG: hypothetical protein E3J52_00500 [Promethearchaeota archaeon]|nr:MAG: hypothetical protein E3J52_00500 [Candidatus Lokiarchaeota archaeon]